MSEVSLTRCLFHDYCINFIAMPISLLACRIAAISEFGMQRFKVSNKAFLFLILGGSCMWGGYRYFLYIKTFYGCLVFA